MKPRQFMLYSFLIIFLTLLSCLPLQEYLPSWELDTAPPILIHHEPISKSTLKVHFDEKIKWDPADFHCTDEIRELTIENNSLVIHFSQDMIPGNKGELFGKVTDIYRNSLSFVLEYYGYNPNTPKLLITEFSPRGSKSRPDFIELTALSDGNLAGTALYIGIPGKYSLEYIFPPLEVKTSEIIVLHLKTPAETPINDETDSKDSSSGPNSSDTAWDFWNKTEDHLPGNNGAVTVATAPGGAIMDSVIYTNRTTASDTKYAGFGSGTLLQQAISLEESLEWKRNEGDATISPESCIWSDNTTSTRTLCRNLFNDTNSNKDWYTCASRNSTPGEPNSLEKYTED